MINGVNQGNIDCIIVKDTSRKIKSTFKAKGESEKMEMEKKKTRLTDSINRLHQTYLKRKENDKQKEYEERYKAR